MQLPYAFAYFPWTNCQLGCSSLFVCAIVRFLLKKKTSTWDSKKEVDGLQTIEHKENQSVFLFGAGQKTILRWTEEVSKDTNGVCRGAVGGGHHACPWKN